MGLGLLFAGVSGAGTAVESSLASQQKSDQDQRRESALINQRSQLEAEKEKRLQEIKDAPIKRLQDAAQRFGSEDVPVTATAATVAPVKATGPAGLLAAGLQDGIKVPDYAYARAQLDKLTDDNPDKAGLIAQLERQHAGDQNSAQVSAQKAADDSVAGQTRKRTNSEALDAAVDWAKQNDLPAYAAGKGLIADKTMSVGEGSTIINPQTGKVIFSNSAKADRTDAMEAGRDRRHDEEMKMQQKKLDAMVETNKAGTPDAQRVLRNQVVPVLTGDINRAQDKIEQISKSIAKQEFLPQDLIEAKAEIVKQQKIIDMTSKSRMKFFTDAGVAVPDIYQASSAADPAPVATKPIAALPPGAKQVGTSNGRPVFEDANGKRYIQN